MHHKDNVNLHPVNLTFDDIKQAAAESLMVLSILNSDARDRSNRRLLQNYEKNCRRF